MERTGAPDLADRLAQSLTSALVRGEGTNDLLHRLLAGVGGVLDAPRVVLYDYDESCDAFDLLYFRGYPEDARSELRTRLRRLEPRRALRTRQPLPAGDGSGAILLPLYFQDTLEALLLLEGGIGPGRLDELAPALRLVSRFLGLFLSSMRLPFNRERTQARADLDRAREVQVSYLPPAQAATELCEIFGYNQSSALIGGDYFDYFCRRPDSLQFVIADACGHGLPAAATMCAFRAMLHAEVEGPDDLSGLFESLNHRFYDATGALQYLSGVFCDYDRQAGHLRYFNAGHFSPVLIRPDGSQTVLTGRGRPLGMFHDSTYELYAHPVAAGDLVVLYTDGLFELCNAEDEFFGTHGIVSIAAAHRDRPLRDVGGEMLASAARFSHSAEPDDDLTVFLVRFR